MNGLPAKKLFLTLSTSLILLSPMTLWAQDAARGAQLFQANNCIQCHGAEGQGVVSELGPRIGGQFDWYILKTLNDFQSGARINAEMMPYIQSLTEQDFRDLAAYIAGLSGVDPE